MRSGGNFSPEWGYLAPAPNFARTARVVLVATAIGATAGAGVVLSLIDRPSEPQQAPIAAHAIVTSIRAAAVPSVSPAGPITAAVAPANAAAPQSPAAPAKPGPQPATLAAVPRIAPATAPVGVPAANANLNPTPAANQTALPAAATGEMSAAVTASSPATASAGEITALPTAKAEGIPADASNGTTIAAPEPAVPPKKTKRQAANKPAPFAGIGSMLRRAFASHRGRSYYPQ